MEVRDVPGVFGGKGLCATRSYQKNEVVFLLNESAEGLEASYVLDHPTRETIVSETCRVAKKSIMFILERDRRTLFKGARHV